MKENNQRSSTNAVFAALIAVSCFFIAAGTAPLAKAAKHLVYYALFPSIESAAFFTEHAGATFDNLKAIVSYRQENISLKKQNIELLDKLRSLQGIFEENARLRALLSLPSTPEAKAVFARVVLRESSQWYQWMIINKGRADAITEELAVIAITPDGFPFVVGRVAEVFDYSSKVALITNSKSVVPLQFAGTNVDCLGEGDGTRYVKLTYIPQEAKISVGDEVLTSPLSSVFKNITPFGRVKEVLPGETIGYQTALAELYLDENKTYEVAVIVPVAKEKESD
jgi:rod shape-determining protein MreC